MCAIHVVHTNISVYVRSLHLSLLLVLLDHHLHVHRGHGAQRGFFGTYGGG